MLPLPHAGTLRQRITIQSATTAADASGQLTETWSTYATRWAEVLPTAGGEQQRGMQRRAEVTHVLKLHHDSLTAAVTPRMRALWLGRTLNFLRAYDPDGRGRTVEIEAREDV
jgi:SPP1 family predicted phage head-tail adaptor